jgi:hypothetical protein
MFRPSIRLNKSELVVKTQMKRDMKVAVFCFIAPCSLVEFCRRFRGTCCFHHISLMMEAASTSEKSVYFYQTTRRYNPEDSHIHTRHLENLESYKGTWVRNLARRPATVIKVFMSFLSPSKEMAVDYDRFLPHPFQFMSHKALYHSTLHVLSSWKSRYINQESINQSGVRNVARLSPLVSTPARYTQQSWKSHDVSERSCLIGGSGVADCWLMLESDDEFSFLLPGVGIEWAGCLGHRSMTSPRGCGGVRQGVKYGSVRM